jgi:hypothetical protein
MESAKRQRFTPKTPSVTTKKQLFHDKEENAFHDKEEQVFYCCYCSNSTNNKRTLYHGFNSRLHYFLISLGILENKLLCCKTCYMQVEKDNLEDSWLAKNLSLQYEGYFEENTHVFPNLNIIGDYCMIIDTNPDNMKPCIIISISDDHKSFVITRFSKK